MNILITGTNGFLASYFKQFNNLEKHKLFFGTTSKKTSESDLLFKKNYENISEVISNISMDIIVHFACVIPKSFQEASYEKTFLPNCEMMNNLMIYSLENKVSKFIYLSSFGSMDDPDQLDTKDYYTISKITGEHFCAMMASEGLSAVSFRISAPYGEYMRIRSVIRIFIENCQRNIPLKLYGSGSRMQNFTYAGDVLQAIELVINSDKILTGVYNIVGSKSVSMLELANIVKKVTESNSEIVFSGKDPQENYRPKYNFSKAKQDFLYLPKFDLEDGIARFSSWLKTV